MAIDPRRLQPGELCGLLNSTPLGKVISERQLYRHRTRAGLRVGDNRHVDLIRYVAWLVRVRHQPKAGQNGALGEVVDLAEVAEGAAILASLEGQGQRLSRNQEAMIAALLTEPSHAAAAAKVGVSAATLYRWLRLPAFRNAYNQARRTLLAAAIGRVQGGTGQAVETLLAVARQGRRDSDRVRAAVALLDYAFRGLKDADLLQGKPAVGDASPMDTAEVVHILSRRLRRLDQADLPVQEQARLTAGLADAVLRAIGVDVLDKRLEALQDVLQARNDSKKGEE